MREIVWAAPSRRSLREILLYYHSFDPDLAWRIVDAIEAAPGKLLDFPEIGSPTRLAGVRRWRVHGLPFGLTYRLTSRGIRILEVRHVARERERP